MEAGRDLDLIIHEKIFKRIKSIEHYKSFKEYSENRGEDVFVPKYSTNLADAWEIVEKLRKKKLNFCLSNGKDGNNYQAEFRDRAERAVHTNKRRLAEAKTAPHAICLAAFKTLKNQKLTDVRLLILQSLKRSYDGFKKKSKSR